jgi:hypothetical protein
LEEDFWKAIDPCGVCKIKNKSYFVHNTVCKFFVLRKGLHTQKILLELTKKTK